MLSLSRFFFFTSIPFFLCLAGTFIDQVSIANMVTRKSVVEPRDRGVRTVPFNRLVGAPTFSQASGFTFIYPLGGQVKTNISGFKRN